MKETIKLLIDICSLIGLNIDIKEVEKIKNDCEKVTFIHYQIYKYLGG